MIRIAFIQSEKINFMKKTMLILILFSAVGLLGAKIAVITSRINYVYIPAVPGPPDACTVLLYDYTFINNGQSPVTRTASSIPLTVGCRLVSIYPDGEGGDGFKINP